MRGSWGKGTKDNTMANWELGGGVIAIWTTTSANVGDVERNGARETRRWRGKR